MKAKKIILAIVIIIAILSVLGGIFACLWFFTGIFNFLKPANDVWTNQMEKALNVEGAKFSDYSDFLKEYKEYAGKPYKLNLDVSANLKISELDSETQELINNSKIKLESATDIENNKAQNKIGLYSKNSEVLTLDIVANDGKFGVGCKDLSDKYLAVSADDLVDYLKKNGNYNKDELEMMSKMFSGASVDPYELLYISDEDLKHFDDTYRNCLKDLISKDYYSTEKDAKVEVDGNEVKTTGYILTLTGKDAYKLAEDFSKLVKEDSVITRIITEKANLMLDSMGQDKIKEKDVDELKNKLFDELLKELKGLEDETDSAIQIAIYSKNNKPVRIDINVVADDEKESLISIEYADKKNIYTIYNNGKTYASIVDEYEKNSKEERVGKLTAKVAGQSVGTLDYEIISKESENKLNLSLDIPLANVSGKINIESKGNYKKEPVDISGLISFNYNRESAEIKFNGKMEYGDVSIPELTSSNSINILKLSESELNEEMSKIAQKAAEVLPERLKLLGIDINSSDILKNTTSPSVSSEVPELPETPNTDITLPTTPTIPNGTSVNTDDIQKSIDETQKMIDQYKGNTSIDTTQIEKNVENAQKILEQNKSLMNSMPQY